MVVEVERMQESADRQQGHLSSWHCTSTPEQQIDSGREKSHCLLLHDTGEPTRAQWRVPKPVTQMALDKLSGPENDTKDMNSGREFGGEWFTEGVGDKKKCLLGDNDNEYVKLSKHSWLIIKISKNI